MSKSRRKYKSQKLKTTRVRPEDVIVQAKDTSTSVARANSFGLCSGGLQSVSGIGSNLDKSKGMFYAPTIFSNRQELETIYNESWACKAFIDYPIDDMFVRWRSFCDLEDEERKALEVEEAKYKVEKRLSKAMKGGRLFGTCLLVLVTKEAPLDKPLDVEKIRPGDLCNLLVVDRFNCSVFRRETNPYSQNYNQPEIYRVTLRMGAGFYVHHSRVLRFDGHEPLTSNGWDTYNQDWGVSEIIPVLTSIFSEDSIARGSAHLVQQSTIDVFGIENFQDAMIASGCGGEEDLSLSDRLNTTTFLKSIYRSIYMDKNDTFDRKQLNIAGLAELMNVHSKRLAAAAQIPATRFLGQSPIGMNATGESDAQNYAMQVNANQAKYLTDPLFKLDQVIRANAGMPAEPIEYEWNSLTDISEAQQATTLLAKTQAAVAAVQGQVIDENEARAILDGDPLVGNLEQREEFEFEISGGGASNGQEAETETSEAGTESEAEDGNGTGIPSSNS